MRVAITFIVFFFVLGFSYTVMAQVTAVMQAKVTIISGAGLTSLQEADVNLTMLSKVGGEIDAGHFTFVAAPGTDVNVRVTKTPNIKNEEGEQIDMATSLIRNTDSETGEHEIFINGKVKSEQVLRGNYQGNVTAVIEYL